jgi:hypothetical protein
MYLAPSSEGLKFMAGWVCMLQKNWIASENIDIPENSSNQTKSQTKNQTFVPVLKPIAELKL